MAGATVRIEVLGPVRAWRDGEPVALRGVSARTVVAALALRLGSVVSTGELCEALWEDDPPDGAVANLQSVVSRLRRGLGATAIGTAPDGYRLVPEGVSTDLADVEALLADTLSLRPETADQLLAALRAWKGHALADVAATTWFLPDRGRLAELQLLARDRCSESLIALDRPDAALIELQRAVAETPLREPTRLLLAEALHRLGRNAEGLRAIDTYRRALVEETGLDPSEAVAEMEQRLLVGDSNPSRRGGPQWRARRWLPPGTPFVGRDRALRSCEELVARHRLVTVVGTGGVGKSRLAMELLHRRDPESAVVVLLAPLDPGAPIETTLAAELGLEATAGNAFDAVAGRLIDLPPLLLVLDNCEHVLTAARGLVDGLLRRVDDLTVLTTSRQRLGLPEEQLLLLEPLDVAADDDPTSGAAQLFRDRVARAAPDLELGDADASRVGEICRLLEGLPLALELAAARAHLLGLDGLQVELARGRLPGPGEGRTMKGAVAWSLGLLGTPAQRLFADLCAFPGPFDLDAVDAITQGDATEPFGELVDASLIAVMGGDGRRRFRILEPIRQVGAVQVAPRAVDAYLDWVIGLGERARSCFIGWEPFTASEIIADHVDDFRHALTILAGRADHERFAHLASQLSSPLYRRPDPELVGLILEHSPDTPDGLLALVDLESGVGRPERCVDHLEQLLGLVAEDDPRVPRALVWSCPAFASMGELDRMVEFAKRAVEHAATTDLERLTAVGMWALGQTYLGRPDVAERIMAEHANVLQLGPTAFIPFVRAEMCATADPEAALAWLDEGAAQARREGDALLSRMLDVARLALLVRESHDAAACRLALDSIPELLAAGLTPQAWMSLRHVATLLARRGEPTTALEILDAAAASPDATALVGDAIEAESTLRLEIGNCLRAATSPVASGTTARSIGELWDHVDEALGRVTRAPRLRAVG